MPRPRRSIFALIAPGLLIAATGVGAGDLATAGFSGMKLGVGVAWAIVLGALMKLLLTEGLTRWQLATGTTVIEGAAHRIGRWTLIVFLAYFLVWSFFTARALMNAAGVAGHALLPVLADPASGKIMHAIAHGLIALAIVRLASFKRFEQLMGVTIALMFVTVVTTAVLMRPDWGALARGLLVPTIPAGEPQGVSWTIALIGGVGGTVTILCYAYWVREQGRETTDDLTACRIDLSVAYALTALFGVAMLVIASGVDENAKGASLIVRLAERIEPQTGAFGRWIFLIGAWAAIFSSVLGVWQAVPYLFADLWRVLLKRDEAATGVSTSSRPFRLSQLALVLVPMSGLFGTFENAQRHYTVVGALFLPLLALALLRLNTVRAWMGRHANRPWTTLALIATALFFLWIFALKLSPWLGAG